jgi:hypothetical protein
MLCGVLLNDSVFYYVIGDSWLTDPTVWDCSGNHNHIWVFAGWKWMMQLIAFMFKAKTFYM